MRLRIVACAAGLLLATAGCGDSSPGGTPSEDVTTTDAVDGGEQPDGAGDADTPETGPGDADGGPDNAEVDAAPDVGPGDEGGDADASTCVCEDPPGPCWAAEGECVGGECVYEPLAAGGSCDDGDPCTTGDACDGDGACAGSTMACDTPPGECFGATGVCDGGECSYEPLADTACDDGDPCTTGDLCGDGVCSGEPVVCDAPPASACADATTLQVWAAPGLCNGGTCEYALAEVECPSGCSDGACAGDPCAGVVCDDPPGDCFEAQGQCAGGVCQYAPDDGGGCDDGDACTTGDVCAGGSCGGAAVVCDDPPAAECADSETLTTWAAEGTCQTDGSCDYAPTGVSCAFGCDAGACAAPVGVVISELFYDATGADDDTFVELHGPAGLSLDGFTLYGVNGSSGDTYQTIALTGAIGSDGLFVVANTAAAAWVADEADMLDAGANYQNGPDSVVLAWEGQVVDAVAYGDFGDGETSAGEGTPAAAAPTGQSLTRDDAFTDTDDNATDFGAGDPTPGAGPGPVCTDACPLDATQCAGALIQTCEVGATGCLEWSAGVACPGAQSCTGAGECGLVVSADTELCGEHVVDGPFAVQGGATITCPSGALTIRAKSIFVDPGSSIDLSGTSASSSGSLFNQCSGSCNGNGVGSGAGGGGNATKGGNGSSTQFEVKYADSCGGWWGWQCTTCGGASGGNVRGVDYSLEPTMGGAGGDGCTANGYGSSASCLGDWLAGGLGGGTVELYADESVTLLGTVDVRGQVGTPGPDGEPDIGAGGGAGGTAVVVAPEVAISGTIRASGGAGSYGKDFITGDCADTISTGGDGGEGWIKVAHGASYTADGDAFDGGVVVTSFMPPLNITSPTHPDLSLHYNDDLDPIELTWEAAFPETEAWFWRLTKSPTAGVDAGNGIYTDTPAITIDPADITTPGTWYVHIVSVSGGAQIGTLRSSVAIRVNAQPPALSSASHPDQDAWYEGAAKEVITMSWSGPAGVDPASFAGFWYRLDHSAVATPGKAAEGWTFTESGQVIVNEDATGAPTGPGTWYFHVVSEDTLGKLTSAAGTYRVQLGAEPATTSLYGYVEDAAGDPVVGAELTLQPYDLKVTTEDAGYFLLQGVYEGTYAITVEAAGQATLSTSLQVTATTSPVTLTMP